MIQKFRAYDSFAEAFTDWSRLMARSARYADVLKAGNAAEFARGLEDAGYATDPRYSEKLERTINQALRFKRLASEDRQVAGLIGIGQSALAAAYAQLQTTGHNIANVNTPGYVRQEVILETAGGMYYRCRLHRPWRQRCRSRSPLRPVIGREVTNNTSLAAGDAARAQGLVRLDDLLANTDDGLGAALDQLRSALGDLVNRPGDASTREVVMRRADALAEQFPCHQRSASAARVRDRPAHRADGEPG